MYTVNRGINIIMMLCTFSCGAAQRYAMDAAELVEVINLNDKSIHGDSILYRDSVIPSVCPELESENPCKDPKRALICKWQGQEQKYAMLVDEVYDVFDIELSEIKSDPLGKAGIPNKCLVDGVVLRDNTMIIVLNIQTLVQMKYPPEETDIELF
jgi:hypothetical protein